MVEIKVNKGQCQTDLAGKRVQLLSELTIGTAKALRVILDGAPAELKTELTKMFFECILEDLQEWEVENDA